ncbi:MAG: hypothetical protein P4L99_21635 [Chthoniobacter sp.]|nr:hypothetical protein [Chthoniobacter sp.]
MANESDGLNIPVRVTLEGDPQAAPAAIKAVQEATDAATASAKENTAAVAAQADATEKLATLQARTPTAADRAYNQDLSSSAAAAMSTPEEDSAEQRAIAAEERKNSLISQRHALLETELELLNAERAGETAKAQVLEQELLIRREALALQRGTLLSEEEAMATAEAKVVAEREITAQKAAQAAENAEDKVYGARSRVGTLSRNFGADANTGAAIGIGAIGGMMANSAIEELTAKMNQIRVESERESAELQKQQGHWRELASAAKDMEDIQKLNENVQERIVGLQEKLRDLPGEKGLSDNLVGGAQMLKEMENSAMGIGKALLNIGSPLLAPLIEQIAKLQTEPQKAMDRITAAIKATEAAGAAAGAEADKMVAAFHQFQVMPLGDRIPALREQINDLRDQQAGLDNDSGKYKEDNAQLTAQIHLYEAALKAAEAAASKLQDTEEKKAENQKRDEEFFDKLERAGEADYLAQERANAKRAQAVKLAQDELNVVTAQAAGEDAKAKALEEQLRMEREIKELESAGVDHDQAVSIAEQTRAQRQLIDDKKQADADEAERAKQAEEEARNAQKLQKINDEDAIEHAKARHNEAALARAERAKAEDKHRRKLEDAGLSGDDLESKLSGEMKDYDRQHRGNRINGHATPAKVQDGLDDNRHLDSAPMDPNDSLRAGDKGPSADFNSLLHGGPTSGALGGGNNAPSADFQKLNPLTPPAQPAQPAHADAGKGGEAKGGEDKSGGDQKKAAEDQTKAAEGQKKAADDAKKAASDSAKAISDLGKHVEEFGKAVAQFASKAGGGDGTGSLTDSSSYTSDYSS